MPRYGYGATVKVRRAELLSFDSLSSFQSFGAPRASSQWKMGHVSINYDKDIYVVVVIVDKY